MNYNDSHNTLVSAQNLDKEDKLSHFRQQFSFPKNARGDQALYFAGHSLGLRPQKAIDYVHDELKDWGVYGVEGHFEGEYPWLPYHEFITDSFSRLVGAKPEEVVAMNTLTVNLHLMMVSFYRPKKNKYKILIENNTFPSDKYAVDSQARFHGFDPAEAVIQLEPESGQLAVSEEKILETIEKNKDTLSLVMLGNCNYLSGQCFPFEKIVKVCHQNDILVGFNLAHGAGNLSLNLHDWGVDFAVWCSYKYLNSGPGGIAGCFVHENHLGKVGLPRFEGWWGHDKKTRFKMGPHFKPIPTVEAWQLSNPPIFQLAALRASMELFDQAGIDNLREKGDRLTSYLEFLLLKNCGDFVDVMTPAERGSMLCLRFKTDAQKLNQVFKEEGVICDFREPDILRMTPVPLYNTFEDVYRLVDIIKANQ